MIGKGNVAGLRHRFGDLCYWHRTAGCRARSGGEGIHAVAIAQGTASSVRSPDHFHELGNLAPLFGSVACDDRLLDAMAYVIAQDFLFGASQRGTHGRDLGDDIDAVSILFEHPGKAADLAFDSIEPSEAGRLDIFAHA